jgi:hypothetical protein
MKINSMDWKAIIILSTFGPLMGFLSVKGFTLKLEPFLWLLFGIATSLILSKNIEHNTMMHGLCIGLLWGIGNGLIQTLFFENYLANNPQVRDNFIKITFIQPRYFVLVTAPVIGLITGLVLGGLSLILKKVW